MKRSTINQLIDDAIGFLDRHRFRLPALAFWAPKQWAAAGHEADEIRSRRLGWDVTDFGSGDFGRVGLLLFTLRNGVPGEPGGKTYAEKIMIVREGQITPFHFHRCKTEDIINRGAGRLAIQLYNSDAGEGFAESAVRVSCDGVVRQVVAGGTITLGPGESITLVPGLYHQFCAEAGSGMALIGEVSSVNDDATDNRFHRPLARFPAIEEDEAPRHLLCNEYPAAR